ncbi:unnamed protein product [Rhizophagus irregularis]|nr:unnamed protein product [Rhizophagus irregularis]
MIIAKLEIIRHITAMLLYHLCHMNILICLLYELSTFASVSLSCFLRYQIFLVIEWGTERIIIAAQQHKNNNLSVEDVYDKEELSTKLILFRSSVWRFTPVS